MTKMTYALRLALITALFFIASSSRADDASVARDLTSKGAQFKDSKGIITDAQISDATNWTDDDFKKLAQLTHIQMLGFGKGLTDHQLALLAPLTEVSYIQTNLIAVTDEGTKSFSQFKKLRTLKLFHPGKSFTGVQLASLAAL